MKSRLFLAALIFGGCLFVHLAGLGALPLQDRDEPRFAEASREMLERHNFVVPTFNGQERLDKPPFFNWCQAASFCVFGQNDFAARVPSALAGALTALLIFLFGTRLYGEKTSLIAAAAFTLCVQTLILAKASVVDMTLVAFTTFGLWAGWEILNGGRRFWWWAFYTTLALGFLIKGPVGLLPLGSLLAFIAWPPRPNPPKSIRPLAGIFVTSLIILLWALPALFQTQGRYFQVGIGEHVIGRSLHPMQGHGAKHFLGYLLGLPFYFVTYILSFFPASLFSLTLFIYFKDKENRGDKERYLLSSVGLVFVIFTLVKTKLPHYTYPAFPALALLFGNVAANGKIASKKIAIYAAAMALASLSVGLFLFPAVSKFFPVPNLARQARPWLGPDMAFASSGYNEPSLVWYFRKNVHSWRRTLKEEELVGFMRVKGPRFCVLPTSLAASVFPKPDPRWRRFEAAGINPAKGRRVDLTLILKSDD